MRSDGQFEDDFDSIDEEFDSIIAGFSEDAEALGDSDTDGAPVDDPASCGSAAGDSAVPGKGEQSDDGRRKEGQEAPSSSGEQPPAMIGLILLPLGPASAVAQMLGMYSLARWVVPIGQQTAVWLELEAGSDDEFNELLGDDRPIPQECDRFARALSRMTRLGAVAMVSTLRQIDGEPQGDVLGRRYVSGEPEQTIPAGLLLNTLDARAEDLLLGRVHPRDLPDAIHPQDRPEGKRGFGRPFRFGR